MERVDYQSIVIQDLINLEKTDELDVKPWYQRRSVWNTSQKSYLINTLHEQKPIPAIYIRHSLDIEKGKSIKEVVDGQQRIRSILEYEADGFTAWHPEYDKKIKFSKLKQGQQKSFLLTSIPVGYLLGAEDSDVIDIFGRINSVAKSLNAQEKRNAVYSGEFKQFCLKEAVSYLGIWRNYNIFSANDIARMNEIQFISDLVINFINGLSDYGSSKIDKCYKAYDEEFTHATDISKRLERVFDLIVNLNPSSIMDTIFKRQPIFFSLLIVLDSLHKLDSSSIEKALYEMDSIFNSDTPLSEREEDDITFFNACTSTTQRIAQRKIRDNYIRMFLV